MSQSKDKAGETKVSGAQRQQQQKPKPQSQPQQKSQSQPQTQARSQLQLKPQPLPLFYKRVVPLSREQNGELYIETVAGYAFAAGTNSIYVSAVEFPMAIGDYPIVFTPYGDGIFPVLLLGLKNNQNLFVNDKGEWDAGYIPAYARRYPFILATPQPGSDRFTVCIDEAYPGFNTAKEGQPLFDEKGEHTPMLTQAVNFLKEYQGHVQMTMEFCKTLVDLQLLEPMQANVKLLTGEDLSIGGFQCIKREKLQQLSPGKIADLVKTGQMELIYAHLLSLNNITKLINKLKN